MSEQKAEKNDLIESPRIPPENYFTLGWGSPEYTDWMDWYRVSISAGEKAGG
jgi:hypothetical protein